MDAPRFASSLSTALGSGRAEREAAADLLAELEGQRPDLLAVFATHHHAAALHGLARRLGAETGAGALLGCTAESVIGGGREVEGEPALALWAGVLPGTRVRSFHVTAIPGPDGEPMFSGFPEISEPERASLLVLGDPFSFPVHAFLERLNAEFPGVPAVGGMASGGSQPGEQLLLTGEGAVNEGLVGVVLEGGIEVRPVVSQGCRPVAKPWVITACEENVVEKLGGQPALDVLQETMASLTPEDRELFRNGPFVGLAVDANKTTFQRGDFLVRGLAGLDQKRKLFAVSDRVRRGQTIQFLVRDADSAGEDLRHLLRIQGGGAVPEDPRSAGALLFSCNGRGSRMVSVPDHDVGCVHAGLARDLPLAGFFAAGEIGPVGNRNFLHGFTASVAVFRPRAG